MIVQPVLTGPPEFANIGGCRFWAMYFLLSNFFPVLAFDIVMKHSCMDDRGILSDASSFMKSEGGSHARTRCGRLSGDVGDTSHIGAGSHIVGTNNVGAFQDEHCFGGHGSVQASIHRRVMTVVRQHSSDE